MMILGVALAAVAVILKPRRRSRKEEEGGDEVVRVGAEEGECLRRVANSANCSVVCGRCLDMYEK